MRRVCIATDAGELTNISHNDTVENEATGKGCFLDFFFALLGPEFDATLVNVYDIGDCQAALSPVSSLCLACAPSLNPT